MTPINSFINNNRKIVKGYEKVVHRHSQMSENILAITLKQWKLK